MNGPWRVAPVLGVAHVKDAVRYYSESLGFECTSFYGVEDGPGYGLRDFVVEDLDGNRLVFGSPKR